jgi:hypothetical protein
LPQDEYSKNITINDMLIAMDMDPQLLGQESVMNIERVSLAQII